jgi:[pyruvate, water dikinase]-phosphate phosphotransferase / [pyruvate, water dikinase] kinase
MAKERPEAPPIFVVSGGVGTSGEQVVNTILAQFHGVDVPVITIPSVRNTTQVTNAIAQAKAADGTIVHTLVDGELRTVLVRRAADEGVIALDLMGPLIEHLADILGQAPLGRPGFYRQLNATYFERVDAIEYAMAHDDGRKRQDWPEADVLLLGVSRTGKTPLSMYLAVLGWKAANLPLVPEISTPPEIYELDRSRVIGLTIDLDRLVTFRMRRARHMGMAAQSSYAHPGRIEEELRAAHQVFRRGRFHVINVTDIPVEASADEVIKQIVG